MSRIFSRTFVPSRRILSYPVVVKKSNPSGVDSVFPLHPDVVVLVAIVVEHGLTP
jgi:hypothetical protein